MESDSRVSGFDVSPTVADLAVEAWGENLAELFQAAGRGLFSVMCDLETVRATDSIPCAVDGSSPEALLVRWLNELIYLHEVHSFLAREVRVDRLTGSRVEGRLIGEPVDPDRHGLGLEVKAATLHRLRVFREADRWRAYVILDV